jgi:putative membrane protein
MILKLNKWKSVMKRIVFLILTITVVLVPAALMAQWRDGYGCWGFSGRNFGYGGGIMMIATVAILALLVFFAVRTIRSHGNPLVVDPTSILKTRYAKGEITKEQYQGMKNDIQ